MGPKLSVSVRAVVVEIMARPLTAGNEPVTPEKNPSSRRKPEPQVEKSRRVFPRFRLSPG
jgi:hypothetical protein